MKRHICFSFAFVVITLLTACKGSDTYRGDWKALNSEGAKFDLLFEENTLTVTDSAGKVEKFEYKQNSINLSNHVETYGISITDQGSFKIVFPSKAGENKGYIATTDDRLVFSIAKGQYLTYEQVHHSKD